MHYVSVEVLVVFPQSQFLPKLHSFQYTYLSCFFYRVLDTLCFVVFELRLVHQKCIYLRCFIYICSYIHLSYHKSFVTSQGQLLGILM